MKEDKLKEIIDANKKIVDSLTIWNARLEGLAATGTLKDILDDGDPESHRQLLSTSLTESGAGGGSGCDGSGCHCGNGSGCVQRIYIDDCQ